MKITCTQHEKELLIKTIIEGKGCPFDTWTSCIKDCEKCLEKLIKWKVKDCENE